MTLESAETPCAKTPFLGSRVFSSGFLRSDRQKVRAQERLTKPKKARTAPNNFDFFLKMQGHYPVTKRVMSQIASESSPESSAKSLSHKFFGIPLLCLRQESPSVFCFFGLVKISEGKEGHGCGVLDHEEGPNNNYKHFLQKLFENPRTPGHPRKIPGTSQVPLFETPKKRLSREERTFRPPPFAWKTPTPTQ